MRIALFGPTGHLGEELMSALPRHSHKVVPIARSDADLRDADQICRQIDELRPDAVINAAAMCGMENCAVAPDVAMAVNGVAPGIMADAAKKAGAIFIHFSTDYVFMGKEGGLAEDETPDPCGVYGSSKLAGEEAVARIGGSWYIFRVSSIYGRRLTGMLGAVQQAHAGKGTRNNPITVLHQFCAPTSVQLIASTVARLLAETSAGALKDRRGLYHLAVHDGVWKLNFTTRLLSWLSARDSRYADLIVKEGALALDRPVHSQLRVDKFEAVFGALPSWRSDLGAAIISNPVMAAA